MANINKQCSVFNAFNFRRDLHETIGHVLVLTLGKDDLQLTADIKLNEPIGDADVQTVGPIASFSWEGGYAQPIQIALQISQTNKDAINAFIHNKMQSVKVKIDFVIYDFDRDEEVFYESVRSAEGGIECILQVQGKERVIYVANDPSHEVEHPVNYQLVLGLEPEDIESVIHVALSNKAKIAKQFGVAVS
jgi:hypothetical protein